MLTYLSFALTLFITDTPTIGDHLNVLAKKSKWISFQSRGTLPGDHRITFIKLKLDYYFVWQRKLPGDSQYFDIVEGQISKESLLNIPNTSGVFSIEVESKSPAKEVGLLEISLEMDLGEDPDDFRLGQIDSLRVERKINFPSGVPYNSGFLDRVDGPQQACRRSIKTVP